MEKELIQKRAQDALMARDFELAVRLLKMLLRDSPGDTKILKELGAAYVRSGDDRKALMYYEQTLAFSPRDTEAMNSMGAIYRRIGEYGKSISILQRALDEAGESADVNYNLGFTYKEMGNYDDAIDAFESVVRENPADVLAYNHIGMIYLARKNYAKAAASFVCGLRTDPNHPILQYNLAKCHEATGQYSDAIRCYEAALRARPGWQDAVRDYGSLLVKCQKTREAADLVRRALALHPDDPALYSVLGNLYLAEYDYDNAEKNFRQAEKYAPSDIDVLSGLAEALEKGEKPHEALRTVMRALELEPKNREMKKQYTHVLLSAGEYAEAHRNIASLYEDSGRNDAQILDLYAQYFICTGDDAKAEECFGRIRKVAPEYSAFTLSAADRYNQKGKFDMAEKMADEYTETNANDPAGFALLGQIYAEKGDRGKAIEMFDRSLSLNGNNVLARNRKRILETEHELAPEPVLQDEEAGKAEAMPLSDRAAPDDGADSEFDFSAFGDDEQEKAESSGVEAENHGSHPDESLSLLAEEEPLSPIPALDDDTFPGREDDGTDGFFSMEAADFQEDIQDGEAEFPDVNGVISGNGRQPDTEKDVRTMHKEHEECCEEYAGPYASAAGLRMAEENSRLAETAEKLSRATAAMAGHLVTVTAQAERISGADGIPAAGADTRPQPGSKEDGNITGESISETLRKIGMILQDADSAEKYADEIRLLVRLRELGRALPEKKRMEFMSGRTRMQIEYLIARLQGKPGLLATARSLLRTGLPGAEKRQSEAENPSAVYVLATMRSLCSHLEDRELAAALTTAADTVLERMELRNGGCQERAEF